MHISCSTLPFILLLCSHLLPTGQGDRGTIRVKRQSDKKKNVLTIEWQGIHPDGQIEDILGFQVQYKAATKDRWTDHPDLIPFRGPDDEYKATIKDLEQGVYQVRIRIVDSQRNVIVETQAITAEPKTDTSSSVAVSYNCNDETLTEPRDIHVEQPNENTLRIRWQKPQCGTPLNYIVQIYGKQNYAYFDVREIQSNENYVDIDNLIPGSKYELRIGSQDYQGRSQAFAIVKTETRGRTPRFVDSRIQYISDSEISVQWDPMNDVDQYKVYLNQKSGDVIRLVQGDQVGVHINSYTFSGLQPSTSYRVGVVGMQGDSVRHVAQLLTTTTDTAERILDVPQTWFIKPFVAVINNERIKVQFDGADNQFDNIFGFILEYRDKSSQYQNWQRAGDLIRHESGRSSYDIDFPIGECQSNCFLRIHVIGNNQRDIAISQKFPREADECTGRAGSNLNVRAYKSTANSIAFKWEKPRCRGIIDGYDVRIIDSHKRDAGSGTSFSEVSETNYAAVGLERGHTYNLRVRTRTPTGTSEWSSVVSADTQHDDSGGLPGKRSNDRKPSITVVIHDHRSYFTWSWPYQSTDPIDEWTVEYKKTSELETHRLIPIRRRSEDWACPAVSTFRAVPNTYCWSLDALDTDTNYYGNVWGRKRNNEVTSPASLTFILIDAKTQKNANVQQFRFYFLTLNSIRVHWTVPPPEEGLTMPDMFRVTLKVITTKNPSTTPNMERSESVNGLQRQHEFHNLHHSTRYNVSVQARFSGNFDGQAIWIIIETPPPPTSIEAPTILQPTGFETSGTVTLSWHVEGDTKLLCCYDIEIKAENERDFRDIGQTEKHIEGTRDYHTVIRGLAPNVVYMFRVIGKLNGQGDTACTSPNLILTTGCQAPSEPPNDLTGELTDQSDITLYWIAPPYETWNCDQISFEVNPKQFGREGEYEQVRFEGDRNRLQFRGNSNTEYEFEIRTVNNAGHSRWSSRRFQITTAKDNLAAIIDLRANGGTIDIEWRAQGDGRRNRVYGYKILYKRQNGEWDFVRRIVPYTTDDERFAESIPGLVIGETYFFKIMVLDNRQSSIYETPEQHIITTCSEPRGRVRISLSPIDSKHMRVMFERPPENSWNCGNIWYHCEIMEPRGRAALQIRDRDEIVLDSEPQATWRIRCRVQNQAGEGPWSEIATGATPTLERIIDYIEVKNTHTGEPELHWTILRTGDMENWIDNFQVAINMYGTQNFIDKGDSVHFQAGRHQYRQLLGELPEGTHIVHVLVYKGNDNFFTSRDVEVHIAPKCRAPTESPENIHLDSRSPYELAVTWNPLDRRYWNCDAVYYQIEHRTKSGSGIQDVRDGEGERHSFQSEPYTEWTIRIRGASKAGYGPWSPPFTKTTQSSAPSVPTNVQVYPITATTATLTWQRPENPNGEIRQYIVTYELLNEGMCYGNGNPAPRAEAKSENTRELQHTIRNLKPNSQYRFRLYAQTAVQGDNHEGLLQTELRKPNEAPDNVRSNQEHSQGFRVSWAPRGCLRDAEISHYEYEIEGVDSWVSQMRNQGRAESTFKSFTDLLPFTTYRVRVRSHNTKGFGPYSGWVTVRTGSADRPNAPENLQVVDATTNSITLMWVDAYPPQGEIDRYRIRHNDGNDNNRREREFMDPRRLQCTPEYIRRATAGSRNVNYRCALVDKLESGQRYEFQMQSHISTKEYGPWSNTVHGSTKDEGPISVVVLEQTGSTDRSIDLRWDVDRSQQHRIREFHILYHPVNDDRRPLTKIVESNIFNYRIIGLQQDTTYSVTVTSVTDTKVKSSERKTMNTAAAPVPDFLVAPRLVSKTAKSITVGWNAPTGATDATQYIVEYSLDGRRYTSFGSPLKHSSRGQFTHTITGLRPNSVAYIRVVAVGKGVRGKPSPGLQETTDCDRPQIAPLGFAGDGNSVDRKVRFTWRAPSKETWNCNNIEYEISYKTTRTQREQIVQVAYGKTELMLPTEPNVLWTVKIRSKNIAGNSDWSAQQAFQSKSSAPNQLSLFDVKATGPDSIKVTWNQPSEPNGRISRYIITHNRKRYKACGDREDLGHSQTYTANPDERSYIIRQDLTPYTEYEVCGAARTTETGPRQCKTVTTYESVPRDPINNFKSEYIYERSARFTWSPPDCRHQNGKIIFYRYYFSGEDSWVKHGSTSITKDLNVPVTSVDLDNLIPYTKYVIKVEPHNSMGAGPITSTTSGTFNTKQAEQPQPPQDLHIGVKGETYFYNVSVAPPYPPYGEIVMFKIDLKDANGKHKEYRIPYSESQRCGLFIMPDGQASLPKFCLNITNLEPGSRYELRAAAKITKWSEWGRTIVAYTLIPTPGAPGPIQVIDKSESMLHIKWEEPEDSSFVKKYKVEWVIDGKLITREVDAPIYKIDGLLPNSKYTIKVYAFTDKYGKPREQEFETSIGLIPPVTTAPDIVDYGSDFIKFTYKTIHDEYPDTIASYIIEVRSVDQQFTEERNPQPAVPGRVENKYTLNNLKPNTEYEIRIKVMGLNKRLSDTGPTATQATKCAAPISSPRNIVASSPSARQVRLTWVAPRKNDWKCETVGFELKYKNGSLSGWKIMEFSGGQTDTTLRSSPYTKWTVKMRTTNKAGNSDWSSEYEISTDEAAPSPPTNPTGEPKGPHEIRVEWEPPKNPNGEVDEYQIIYQLVSSGECSVEEPEQQTKMTQSKSISLENLLPYSTYSIRIVAKNGHGLGEESESVQVITHQSAPSGAPTDVKIMNMAAETASLFWKMPKCEERNGEIVKYVWELTGTDEWVKDFHKRGEEEHTVTTVQDLKPFARYSFRVKAATSAGSGDYSDNFEFQTKAGPPSAPRNVMIEESFPKSISMTFEPPYPPAGEIDTYKIEYKFGTNSKEIRMQPDELVCSTGTENNKKLCLKIGDLQASTKYDIHIQAHTKGGDWGVWSSEVEATTDSPNIAELSLAPKVIEVGSDYVKLSWEGLKGLEAEDIIGYWVKYTLHGEEYVVYPKMVNQLGDNGETHMIEIDGLIADSLYFFTVHGVHRRNQTGPGSPERKQWTLCGVPTKAPELIEATAPDYRTVKVSFKAPLAKYFNCRNAHLILLHTNGTGETHRTVFDKTDKEATFKTLPGVEWKFTMTTKAVNEDDIIPGAESKPSEEVSVKVPGTPDDIFVTVEPETTTACISWVFSGSEKDYPFGVLVDYRLVKLADCDNEPHLGYTRTTSKDKKLCLNKLFPGAKYSVAISTVKPPGANNRWQPTQTEKIFRTKSTRPSAPPNNLQAFEIEQNSIGLKWEKPACKERNGIIKYYDVELRGKDVWVSDVVRSLMVQKQTTHINGLQPGTLYEVRVRGRTDAIETEISSPFSKWITVKTLGSNIGIPLSIIPLGSTDHTIDVLWHPPSKTVVPITEYKLVYQMAGGGKRNEEILNLGEVSCNSFIHKEVRNGSLCYKITGVDEQTTYWLKVAAGSGKNQFGDFTIDVRVRTSNKVDIVITPGKITVVNPKTTSLGIQWKPDSDIDLDSIDHYIVQCTPKKNGHDAEVTIRGPNPPTEYTCAGLIPNTVYAITVKANSYKGDKVVTRWHGSYEYQTPEKVDSLLSRLGVPQNLRLTHKSPAELTFAWDAPDLFPRSKLHEIIHYNVTLTPWYGEHSNIPVRSIHTLVPPPNLIRAFENLKHNQTYNVTVQAGSRDGWGYPLWGAYSTLPYGETWRMKLIRKTPTSLKVAWNRNWRPGFEIKAQALFTAGPELDLAEHHGPVRVPSNASSYQFRGLTPDTAYQIRLIPHDQRQTPVISVYSTLPIAQHTVSQLGQCDASPFAVAFRWQAIDHPLVDGYQTRWTHRNHLAWTTEPEKSPSHFRCPGFWENCTQLCHTFYNMPNPQDYVIQVRALIGGMWNAYKSFEPTISQSHYLEDVNKRCCIVPPPMMITMDAKDSFVDVSIGQSKTTENLWRYYVVVDTRKEVPGGLDMCYNYTTLYDKVTAKSKSLPYYIAGAFDEKTLPTEMDFKIGDGKVYGGYINYPLLPGEEHFHWKFEIVWMVGNDPVIGCVDGMKTYKTAGVYGARSAWPWWAILLFVLLLLLLLLLLVCCCWYCSRYRRRRETQRLIHTNRSAGMVVMENGDKQLLLGEGAAAKGDKGEIAQNLKALETRVENIRNQLDTRIHSTERHFYHGSRDGDRESDSDSDEDRRRHKGSKRGKNGDFEGGYVRGFRDANKITSSTSVKGKMDEAGSGVGFQSGYVQGLRDAGMTNMTASMHNLAGKAQQPTGGYSSGYMQGFRDGNSGIYGDRISTTLLQRLEDQYPNQEDYRQGYVDGFRESSAAKMTQTDTLQTRGSDQLSERLGEISERLQMLERTGGSGGGGGKGDEVHTTRVYHVYNQLPEGNANYSAGEQLAKELEDVQISTSKRSTLRRHYTPGDYLKYPSDSEGYGGQASMRSRRSLSASNLGREDYGPMSPTHVDSGTFGSRGSNPYRSNSRVSLNNYNDTFNRRYQYRSRSDVGSGYGTTGGMGRHPSQTLIDGPRPGPGPAVTQSAHLTERRDALEALQRELDSLTRTPIQQAPLPRRPVGYQSPTSGGYGSADLGRGYASDTGYMQDTWRSDQRYNGANVQNGKLPAGTADPYAAPLQQDYETIESRSKYSYDKKLTTGKPIATSGVARRSNLKQSEMKQNREPTHSPTQSAQSPTRSGSEFAGEDFNSPHQPATNNSKSLTEAFHLVFGGADASSSDAEVRGRSGAGADNWADELMQIVQEPMDHTLDRMKRYNTSLSQLPPSTGPSPMTVQPGDTSGHTSRYMESQNASYQEDYHQQQQ